uniref:NADH-ubiquinone oxidoreductase chain 4L n=1 Tax=Cryptocellus narino TaxID=1329480 RepID=W5R4K9_9ARAC|nr:NADH dehydrogenase subunit 4L [Cryptocellus narino]AGL11928.1 NADH dehydrogenase subunit 4L [Cryptocellus narino]
MLKFICFYFYVCGLLGYVVWSGHILLMLLSLEFMVVSLFFFFFFCFGVLFGQYYLLLFFLVVVVCESALGLSLLVSVVRSFGSDMLYSLV